MKRTILPALLSLTIVLIISGCMTVPKPADIPADQTVIQLSQKGQEALDKSNYKAAEVYYQLIIDRYGTDAAALTAAEFEIAHIKIKQKNYADAKTMLEAIVARYEAAGAVGLKPEYLVLAKNDLAHITALETKKTAKP